VGSEDKLVMGTDKILIIGNASDKSKLDSKGRIDNRLFASTENLRATMDPQTLLWSLKYDKGIVPEKLKMKFTKFSKLKQYADDYFALRNMKIVEVKEIDINAPAPDSSISRK
jgi:hypothetical protein